MGREGKRSIITISSNSPLPHLLNLLQEIQRSPLQLILQLDVPEFFRRLQDRFPLTFTPTTSRCARCGRRGCLFDAHLPITNRLHRGCGSRNGFRGCSARGPIIRYSNRLVSVRNEAIIRLTEFAAYVSFPTRRARLTLRPFALPLRLGAIRARRVIDDMRRLFPVPSDRLRSH